ncbi:hypothetical protein JD844_014022 [Phrynosoma platyrhinos]|uniref:Protogenin n=1 Tax=Phrynosoma platyrhinos TaxID=52577 RepID=A0ABQ7SR04_PHRPL|nr:hypothetical protein JD844_014022 [Phrynosoma platyrhinos]
MSAFELQPLPVEVPEGGVARFSCKISASPPAIITWEVNRTTLPIAMDRITALPSGVLQIYGVQQKDAGSYRCVAATVANRRKSTEATLTVLPASNTKLFHKPSIIAGPENITASLHQTVIFECVATGHPKPIISWSRLGEGRSSLDVLQVDSKVDWLPKNSLAGRPPKAELEGGTQERTVSVCAPHGTTLHLAAFSPTDHKPIDVFNTRVLGNGNLMISDVKVLHAGVYVCRATIPGTRNFTTARAALAVLGEPAFASPEPKLVINQIIPEDDAIYQCLAENSQGSILSRARLTVVLSEDRPSAPCNVHAETMSSSAILLAWERPLYNSDKVIAYSSPRQQPFSLRSLAQGHMGFVNGGAPVSTTKMLYPCFFRHKRDTLKQEERQPLVHNSVPKSPELLLEPLNCTTITAKWMRDVEDGAAIQGYKLYYKEEGQQENGPVLLEASDRTHTVSGLDPRRKYHVRLLAYNNMEEGYQADQTVSTPGCVSVRDRMVPPPPPPHHLYAKANSSSSIYLHWGRPAFTSAQVINYTLRCNPVGLQNASLVLYLQTSETHLLVQGLEPGTKYEFAVRLHVDQLSSPWSPVVYHATLPEAPSGPPLGVKVTLIEEDTALVSWKPPSGIGTAVSRYTILYASRKAWVAGEWQVLHREGESVGGPAGAGGQQQGEEEGCPGPWPQRCRRKLTDHVLDTASALRTPKAGGRDTAHLGFIAPAPRSARSLPRLPSCLVGERKGGREKGTITMALLENLLAGNVYLVKISASNEVGEGPFSSAVELAVLPREAPESNQRPKRLDSADAADTAYSGYYQLDQKSMTGIIAGVSIALACIMICILILIYRSKARKTSPPKSIPESPNQLSSASASSAGAHETAKSDHDSAENMESLLPRTAGSSFLDAKSRFAKAVCLYQPDTAAILIPKDSSLAQTQQDQGAAYAAVADTEHSANSEGSHETGDSGRFSHESNEELHLSDASAAATEAMPPPSLPSTLFARHDVCVTSGCPRAPKEPPDLLHPPPLQPLPAAQQH